MEIDKVKLIVIIFGAIIVFLLATRNKGYQFDTLGPANVSNQESTGKQNINQQNGTGNIAHNHNMMAGTASEAPPVVVSPIDQLYAESLKSLQKFESFARLSVPLEDSRFFFTELDLVEDRMIGTYGSSGDSGDSLAILATDMNVNERMVKEYLKEYADELPSLRRKSVQWEAKPQSFEAIQGSGLAAAKVWKGASPDGLIHVAVWIPREDKKGHYAFIYSTPNAQDLDNDGFFDELYAKLKALPE